MKYKSLYIVVTTIIVAALFQCFLGFDSGVEITRENDEWEHQSMAVNFANGHGLHKLGGYDDFGAYDYKKCDAVFPFLRVLHEEFPTEYYHRNIGFSIVAGMVYRIGGNKSMHLKIFHFFLLIIAWFFCIHAIKKYMIDKALYKWLIYLTPVFLVACFKYVDVIGDDIYIVIFFTFLLYAVLSWEAKASWKTTFLMAIFFLSSLLFKSTLVFLCLFLIPLALFKKDRAVRGIQLIFIMSMIALYVITYSNYVNKKYNAFEPYNASLLSNSVLNADWSKEDSIYIEKYNLDYENKGNVDFDKYKRIAHYLFERQFYYPKEITLTGQGTYLFIDGNNEHCATSLYETIGSWTPAWKFDPGSFYHNYDFKTHPLIKVFQFYINKPWFIVPITTNKLKAGFTNHSLMLLLTVFQLLMVFTYLFKGNYAKIQFILAVLAFFFLYKVQIHGGITIGLFLVSGLYLLKKKVLDQKEDRTLIVLYLFAFYFIFLTVLLFGLRRYTEIGNSVNLILIAYWLKEFIDVAKKKMVL